MKFITALVALTAFAAAHEGDHDSQGNHLDAQGSIVAFNNGTKPSYPLPPSQLANSNGSQNQTKEYPLPPSQNGNSTNGSQGGNNSTGNQNGSQGGNQEKKIYPIPSQEPGAKDPVIMDEFQKFMQSPMMQKFMEYMKTAQQNKY
ncbi:hypothetical protein CONCODRAFT_77168 [Conidiobolus coronatus NRRL 28638]|uniref:Uncharacterized protein n=1 Tax=Conidiobolus coronatus (strain ATCC 28846 / CBS 209.66 / NRRL 28638) TaxID=796925 RepID=A0A137PFJ7_CONC2|nr:hypothetical protein CONCODRAFT_77168 [Conidiobolus coronatus NRRL 28638]|eukprot:KXN73778.1 hypothetical protein CONCODRAFT_77168 [Conidiobolus coronatus NRRL 28638]